MEWIIGAVVIIGLFCLSDDIGRLFESKGTTKLAVAAGKGDLEQVNALISEGNDVNASNSAGFSALVLAAQEGHSNVVDVLLKNGADIDHVVSKTGATALRQSAHFERRAVFFKLLESGANPNAGRAKFPLHTACGLRDRRMIEELLNRGADVNAKMTAEWEIQMNDDGNRPLHFLFTDLKYRMDRKEIEELIGLSESLLDRGADINALNEAGLSPLSLALNEDSLTRYLIERGANPSGLESHLHRVFKGDEEFLGFIESQKARILESAGRTHCENCQAEILVQTAAATGGFCMPCSNRGLGVRSDHEKSR